jgi:hypothetical protein
MTGYRNRIIFRFKEGGGAPKASRPFLRKRNNTGIGCLSIGGSRSLRSALRYALREAHSRPYVRPRLGQEKGSRANHRAVVPIVGLAPVDRVMRRGRVYGSSWDMASTVSLRSLENPA